MYEVSLTAIVSEAQAWPATRVEFYLDTNANQALDPQVDRLLGADTDPAKRKEQEEAALDLGATHVQAFRKVLLPFLKPAIGSAAVLAFLASFENYNTTVFTIVSESTLTTVLALPRAARLIPGVLIMLAAFGAGLTRAAGLLRWGSRIEPLGESDAELPPCEQTGLEIMADHEGGPISQLAAAVGRPPAAWTPPWSSAA